MALAEQFSTAVTASKMLAAKPNNETLLQLYSLYKQATEGDAGSDGPTNMFDIVGKAKHEAWSNIAGKSKEDAMQEYVALVEQLKNA